MEPHAVANLVVLGLMLGAGLVLRAARRNAFWREAGRQLWRRRPIALAVVALYVLIALFDSVAWVGGGRAGEARSLLDRAFPAEFRERTYSAPLADATFYGATPLAYPGRHLLGTDIIGRDTLQQTLKGARVALLVGGFTSLLAIPLALLFGVSAGYAGGRVDAAVFFLMSVVASIPSLLLLVALIMVMGKGTLQVCTALGVTGWVGFCRISRGETMKLRELDYVHAARALGVPERRIVVRHVLPNLAHLVVITFALMFSGLVLSEAVLAWLGLGIDGSWGQMIDQARDELARDPIIVWNLAAAATALFGLILAVNLVADALRDVLDPRTLRERG
jgi:peptide/nickel transport system permease protein